MMLVYWLVFSVYMRVEMAHYHVFLFCGLLPWIWFSSALLEGCSSIMTGANLVKKVMFPAEILPIVVVLANLIHFLLALPILLIFIPASGIHFSWYILYFPVVVFVQLLLTIPIVLLLSALAVHYRDIQQILNNLVTLWFFLCPIIYPLTSLPAKAQKYMFFMKLNPMTHLMVAYHYVFLHGMEKFPYPPDAFPWKGLFAVAACSVPLFLFSYRVFLKSRPYFSEEI